MRLNKTVNRFTCKLLVISLVASSTPLTTAIALAAENSIQLPNNDMIAPAIEIPSANLTTPPNTNFTIKAKVTDNVGVQSVVLFYRQIGENTYQAKQMSKSGQADEFAVEMTASEIGKTGIEYYLQAKDTAGNTVLRGYSFSPISLKVKTENKPVVAVPVPAPAPVSVPEPVKQEQFSKTVHTGMATKQESASSNKWLWIGLGVLAVGLAAGGGGGGGGGGEKKGTLSGTVPAPQ